ncbi:MFS transporter [Labrys sp. KB_33_2]|uniref:MFS transporter n=1 Tax=Labrys sp. KB_33_2 TaxID=3237479 RepID=UPI003F927B94
MSVRSKIAIVYLLGFGLDLANMFVVNAAYPALGRELQASPAQLAWTGNAYMLGLTVVIPLDAWMAARWGERRVLLVSLGVFALGAGGSAVAGSLAALLAWRLAQGLGGGALIPVGQAMAYRAYPSSQRAGLTSLVMMVALIVPALSPAIGGVAVDFLSWRWIFIGMLPVAGLAICLVQLWLPRTERQEDPGPLDVSGLATSITALVALLLGLTWLGEGEQAWLASVAIGIAILAGTLHVRRALGRSRPLLELRLLSRPLLRGPAIVYLCVPGVFVGVNLVASLHLQGELGLTASQTGALMIPWSIAAFAAISCTRLAISRSGPVPLLVAGMLVQAGGILLLCASGDWLIPAYLAMGFGGSLCSSAAQSAAFLDVPHRQMGQASALWNINRQLSFCLGVAVMSCLVGSFAGTLGPSAPSQAYLHAFVAAAALSLLPLPAILRLPNLQARRLLGHVVRSETE